MGQIVSTAAKPKRCNKNQLSQLGVLTAGLHVLVSSDNSMNAAGQGNFDCYIVGDGQTAAAALPLRYLSEPLKTKVETLESEMLELLGGTQENELAWVRTDYGTLNSNGVNINASLTGHYLMKVDVVAGKYSSVVATWGHLAGNTPSAAMRMCAFYDANNTFLGVADLSANYNTSAVETTAQAIPPTATTIYLYNRPSVCASPAAKLIETSEGIIPELQNDVEGLSVVNVIEEFNSHPVASGTIYNSLYAETNYVVGKKISGAALIVNGAGTFINIKIPVAVGDVIRWVHGSFDDTILYARVEDSNGNKVGGAWNSGTGNTGERTLTLDNSSSAYFIATFIDDDNYTPAIYVNGVLSWEKSDAGLATQMESLSESVISCGLNSIVRSVNHRGYNVSAPENTMPAFKLSVLNGFDCAETDVRLTADGVPVLLHDETIDRTSDGSGDVSSLTYEQLLTYDFGSWFSSEYTGTKIPTLEEFLIFCKNTGLHPYLELKIWSQSGLETVISIVKECGMFGKVTWLGTTNALPIISTLDPYSRLGYVVASISSEILEFISGLKTQNNEVFIDSYSYTPEEVSLCINSGIPLEVYTLDTNELIINAPSYVTGITSDSLVASKVLFAHSVDD